ncbi:MAG: glutamyl-tRNA reductase [Candidatus Margulisiibacteriota bacterium]|jgi:glutamyl-tRNA reductase
MIELISKDLRCTLEEREKFSRELPVLALPKVHLHTCDRSEIYYGAGQARENVVSHLYRVTAGLEAALLGETAIQGQVKEAYLSHCRQELSPGLHFLFQNALRVGKRVRTETRLSRGAVSHSQVVLEMIKRKDLLKPEARILIIGAGNLNRKVVRYLVGHGGKTFFVANRTLAKAKALAEKIGGQALSMAHLYQILPEMDLVISATAAPHFIIRADKFTPRKEMHMFDLAVPRDIDPVLAKHSQVKLYNIEDIEKEIDQNRSIRQGEVTKAQKIIEQEVEKYFA